MSPVLLLAHGKAATLTQGKGAVSWSPCPGSCLQLLWPSLALDGGRLGTVEEVPNPSFHVFGLPRCELAKRDI